MSDPVDITRGLLEREALGHWEIFHQVSESFTVEIKDGNVDSLQKARISGLAVRVIKDRKLGFSFTSALDAHSLETTVQTAVSMARFMLPDPDVDLAEPAPMPGLADAILKEELLESRQPAKTEMARNIERIAKEHDKRITTIRKSGYTDGTSTVRLANSRGLDAGGSAGFVRAWIELMAEHNGDQEMAYWMEQGRSPRDIDPETVAVTAAQRALESLGGKIIPSSSMPVLMENTVATDLLRILANSFLGESHYKNRASPKIQPGESLFSEHVSIVDDGTDARGSRAFPFDGEGTPSSQTTVVDRGLVKALLFDRYHGRKYDTISTGNCDRGSFESLPGSGITNLSMAPGSVSFNGLVNSVDNGLMVTEMMGLHTANPVTGDFSVGASGFRIRGGKLVHPVKGVAIAGNLIDLFGNVVSVADDFRFFGNLGAPSFLVETLAVSGS